MDAYILEGEMFCEDCCSDEMDGPYSEGGGESDSPQHCFNCHVPLENPLTSEGVKYVINRLKDELSKGIDSTVYDCYKGTWYENSPHYSILLDWIESIKDYNLSDNDQKIVDLFLESVESL